MSFKQCTLVLAIKGHTVNLAPHEATQGCLPFNCNMLQPYVQQWHGPFCIIQVWLPWSTYCCNQNVKIQQFIRQREPVLFEEMSGFDLGHHLTEAMFLKGTYSFLVLSVVGKCSFAFSTSSLIDLQNWAIWSKTSKAWKTESHPISDFSTNIKWTFWIRWLVQKKSNCWSDVSGLVIMVACHQSQIIWNNVSLIGPGICRLCDIPKGQGILHLSFTWTAKTAISKGGSDSSISCWASMNSFTVCCLILKYCV